MTWLSAALSFIGGLASALILPALAWLAGKRKAEGRQKDKVIDDVVAAKEVTDELDQLDSVSLRERARRWVRKRSSE